MEAYSNRPLHKSWSLSDDTGGRSSHGMKKWQIWTATYNLCFIHKDLPKLYEARVNSYLGRWEFHEFVFIEVYV